jgi:hypothetical protein
LKKWTNEQKIIVGKIYFIASDKRSRVLNTDQIEWLERKLAEIKKLSRQLPRIKYQTWGEET